MIIFYSLVTHAGTVRHRSQPPPPVSGRLVSGGFKSGLTWVKSGGTGYVKTVPQDFKPDLKHNKIQATACLDW